MARNIQDYDGQVHPPDSDYLDGDIKDDTGVLDGTLANRTSNADIHQFFMKLLRDAVITTNGLPDNEYNGYQLVEALRKSITFNSIRVVTGVPVISIAPSIDNKLINVDANAQTGQFVDLDFANDDRANPNVRVTNNSPFNVTIRSYTSGTVNDGATYTLPPDTAREFFWDAANTNWVPA